MVKICICSVYSRASAAIFQTQAHTKSNYFHGLVMTQSRALVPAGYLRVLLGVTKKHHPSLATNMIKMGQILSRKITREPWLHAKLHWLSPFLLPSLFLISNNRNLFPDWNRARQKSAIEDRVDKRKTTQVEESRCLYHEHCSQSLMQKSGNQGK